MTDELKPIDYTKYEGCTEGEWVVGRKTQYYYPIYKKPLKGKRYLVAMVRDRGVTPDKKETLGNVNLVSDAPMLLAQCKKLEKRVGTLSTVLKELLDFSMSQKIRPPVKMFVDAKRALKETEQ